MYDGHEVVMDTIVNKESYAAHTDLYDGSVVAACEEMLSNVVCDGLEEIGVVV